MPKNWTTVFVAMLMLAQTLAIASDVFPAHLGDIHHDQRQHHHALGEAPAALDTAAIEAPRNEQSGKDLPSLPDHCHGSHCHGSHLLVVMHVFNLSLLRSEQILPPYNADFPSNYIDTILRPPIA